MAAPAAPGSCLRETPGRESLNKAYYGNDATPEDVAVKMLVSNKGAAPGISILFCVFPLPSEADSQHDRPPGHILSKAVPADQADALGEI